MKRILTGIGAAAGMAALTACGAAGAATQPSSGAAGAAGTAGGAAAAGSGRVHRDATLHHGRPGGLAGQAG